MLERKQSSQQQLLARKNSEAQQFVAGIWNISCPSTLA
jgi:hypothetical protein